MVSGNRNVWVFPGSLFAMLLAGGLTSGQVADAQDPSPKSGPDAPAISRKPAIEVFRGNVRTDAQGNRLVSPLELRRAADRVTRAKQQA